MPATFLRMYGTRIPRSSYWLEMPDAIGQRIVCQFLSSTWLSIRIYFTIFILFRGEPRETRKRQVKGITVRPPTDHFRSRIQFTPGFQPSRWLGNSVCISLLEHTVSWEDMRSGSICWRMTFPTSVPPTDTCGISKGEGLPGENLPSPPHCRLPGAHHLTLFTVNHQYNASSPVGSRRATNRYTRFATQSC